MKIIMLKMKVITISQILVLILFGFYHTGAYSGVSNPTPPQKQNTQQPVQINAIAQTALQKGVNKCAGTINVVTNYLGFSSQSGAVFTPNVNAPDTKTSSVVMEIPLPKNTAIVSATFSPHPNGCQASYDAVIYWPDKCEAVIKSQFSNLKYVRKLKENVMQLEGPNINFYLMAAGKGCISLKKEVTE